MNNKAKFALYLPPEKKSELDRRYQEDVSKSITAFVEKAIDFYLGYLDTDKAWAFLPKETLAAIDGLLGMFEDRMSKLLYKLVVDMLPRSMNWESCCSPMIRKSVIQHWGYSG